MRWILIAAAVLLTGCAGTTVPQETQAVRDFVVVADMEQIEAIRLYRQLRYGYVNDHFVMVEAGTRYYLVEFAARCRALREKNMIAAMVDHRYDPAYVRVRDTIRGCPIGTIYKAPAEQLLEIKRIGKSSTKGTIPKEE